MSSTKIEKMPSGPKIRGLQAFFLEIDNMAFYGAPQPNPQPEPQQQAPGQVNPSILSELWNAIRAGTSGFKQGLIGKNLTFEQWQRERARKSRGFPPGQYPQNWLQRLTRR